MLYKMILMGFIFVFNFAGNSGLKRKKIIKNDDYYQELYQKINDIESFNEYQKDLTDTITDNLIKMIHKKKIQSERQVFAFFLTCIAYSRPVIYGNKSPYALARNEGSTLAMSDFLGRKTSVDNWWFLSFDDEVIATIFSTIRIEKDAFYDRAWEEALLHTTSDIIFRSNNFQNTKLYKSLKEEVYKIGLKKLQSGHESSEEDLIMIGNRITLLRTLEKIVELTSADVQDISPFEQTYYKVLTFLPSKFPKLQHPLKSIGTLNGLLIQNGWQSWHSHSWLKSLQYAMINVPKVMLFPEILKNLEVELSKDILNFIYEKYYKLEF